MKHCSEEELILHYYDEHDGGVDVGTHLASCSQCAETYRSIAGTLQLVPTPDVPDRPDSYPLEVWSRLRSKIEAIPSPWWRAWFSWDMVWTAAATAAVVLAALVAGRVWPEPVPATGSIAAAIDVQAGERVRLAAIGDHLERSERVLQDLVNAEGDRVDLSAEQNWAAELIDSNRLYRDTAVPADGPMISNVLDELERSLLEIVHGPSAPTRAELDAVRTRLDAPALLFKVRVLADELHEREIASLQPRKTT